jgi:hypothetical protein
MIRKREKKCKKKENQDSGSRIQWVGGRKGKGERIKTNSELGARN